MRSWIIVLSSAVLALAAAAAMIWLEPSPLPHTAMLPRLVSLSPTLASVALAVYAICAILLMSGDMVADGLRVRYYLGRNPADHGGGRAGWTAAFAGSGFRRLVPPATATQPSSGAADGTTLVLQGRFRPHEARREVARLFYIGTARVHFFSALVILAAGVVLGAVQARSPLPFIPGPIPTVPAALAVAALILLAVLARIAVDVAAEPLIKTISRQPVESVEAGLLRRTTELLAAAPTGHPLPTAATPEAMVRIPDRLGAVLEQSHLALIEAIERLSVTTDGLAQTTKASLEALEAAFRADERRGQMVTQPSAYSTEVAELREALSALTEILRRPRPAPAADGERAAASAGSREPDLALELHKLLQEIETP